MHGNADQLGCGIWSNEGNWDERDRRERGDGLNKPKENYLLTNGILPLIQTDRLALESIGELPPLCYSEI